MKKILPFLFLVFLSLIILLPVYSASEPLPHPDPCSGSLGDYTGTWIINGSTEESTTWTLEIYEDGEYYSYRLENEYQSFTGDIIFTEGDEELGTVDRLVLEVDPEYAVDIVLENFAGGLVETSGQDFIFVRPGNKANYEEAQNYQNYSKEDMIGDWALDCITAYIPDYNLELTFTNDELMAGNELGEKRLILSFEKGILYEVSEALGVRIPITRYRYLGRNHLYFENPNPTEPFCYKYDVMIVTTDSGPRKGETNMVIDVTPMPPDAPFEMIICMFLEPITGVTP